MWSTILLSKSSPPRCVSPAVALTSNIPPSMDKIGFLVTSLFLVKSICNCSCSWFIDDPHDVETSNDTCILGCLSLGVIEVSRNCHNSILDLFSQVCLSCLLHLYQHHGTDLLRGKALLL